MHLLPRKQL